MALFSRLSAALGLTKAKASRFGGIAELREHVMDVAKSQLNVDSVVAHPGNPAQFTVTMGEWSSVSDVTNLFTYLEANPDEDLEEPVRGFVNSIAESKERLIDESNIVAVIRHRGYVEANAKSEPLHEPLDPDLVIMYMADRPDSMASIRATDLPGSDLTSVREIALNNVRRWLPKVVSNHELGAGALYYVDDNPMLSPSLILLDEFWASVAERFPGDVLIALPRKDQLFVFDDDGDPVARARVRALIDASMEEGFNLLTDNLYARRAGKIVAVEDQGQRVITRFG